VIDDPRSSRALLVLQYMAGGVLVSRRAIDEATLRRMHPDTARIHFRNIARVKPAPTAQRSRDPSGKTVGTAATLGSGVPMPAHVHQLRNPFPHPKLPSKSYYQCQPRPRVSPSRPHINGDPGLHPVRERLPRTEDMQGQQPDDVLRHRG
jgi:hypothetical protein